MRWAAAGCLALFLTACATTAKPPATSASPAKPSALPAQPTTAAPARPAAPPVATPATGGAQTPTTPPERSAAGREAAQPEIKPYERVITKDARSDEGIFTVHRIKEKVFYEIPKKELGKDFLWVTQIARTTLGVGYGGQAVGNRVVRWERKDDRVLLRGVLYNVVATGQTPMTKAVEAANNDAIIMAFNIEALGKDEAPVIDVSRLFTTEVPEFSARTRLRASGFDTARSFVERTVSFPENIEVEASHTFTAPPPSPTAMSAPAPPSPMGGAAMRPGSATVLMHFSMVKLPERPMMPRLFDERVGYFSINQYDYGRLEQKAMERTYLARWRLEKKDPNAEKSEPVKPITFYVDPATPPQWVPWVKKGIEAWQPAFEEAGFIRGIVAKEAPANDPEWSPEDARYSVIRWLPSTIENAMGPHISDPRTGEILEADVQIYHNVMNLARDWYFVQVGPLDPRAKKLPLSDELMGKLLEYIIAHEVGHSLGFQHNFKASSLYPVAKVRDREWVKTMGHVPTLMDYSRFNYVAQPEDRIDPDDLIPKIGPYDKWATMWGYKPIPGARTPDAEKKTLDEWARVQEATPSLRFNTAGSGGADPGEQSEAVGDADAVEASTLGMKNLARVMDMLMPATLQPGEPYDELGELYGRVLGQWVLEMNHVVPIVGGYDSVQRHMGQAGARFTPVSRERQARAMRFLNENAFSTPVMFIRPEILRRIEASGVIERIRTGQQRVLSSLVSPARITRLVEQEAIDGAKAYRPTDMMADLRKGVWRELDASQVRIDAYRRALQRTYLDVLGARLNGPPAPAADEARGLIRAELRDLGAAIAGASRKAGDRATGVHLQDARDQIARILDPKFNPPTPAGASAPRPGLDDGWPEMAGTCWPDYIIRAPKK